MRVRYRKKETKEIIYIYIYRERERERTRDRMSLARSMMGYKGKERIRNGKIGVYIEETESG